MYYSNVYIDFMVENVTQIKSGITIVIDVSVKIWENIVYVKKLYLESCYM